MILRFWINTKSMHLTMTGEIGKPIYMSPELLKDEESLYTSSNYVYAFAIVANEIVTGVEPFKLANKIVDCYRPKFTENIIEKNE